MTRAILAMVRDYQRSQRLSLNIPSPELLLAATGGAIGVIVGIGSAYGLSALGYWETLISWPATVTALVFSAVLGVFFGIYPASRAADLEPIEALRAV